MLKTETCILSGNADLVEVMNGEIREEYLKKENKKVSGLDFFQEQLYNSLLKGTLTAEQLTGRLYVPVSRVNMNNALNIMKMMDAVGSLPGNVYGIK